MRYVRDHGYPAPAVYDVSGPDLVLERVDGPSMVDEIMGRPWRLSAHARTLARLHRRLHEIPAPPWLRGDGGTVLHLDLHPLNVMLGRTGPVVIDWANARAGDPRMDVAMTVVITAGAQIGPPRSWLRDLFVREFARCFDPDEWRGALDSAVAFRVADDNVSAAEKARLRTLRL